MQAVRQLLDPGRAQLQPLLQELENTAEEALGEGGGRKVKVCPLACCWAAPPVHGLAGCRS